MSRKVNALEFARQFRILLFGNKKSLTALAGRDALSSAVERRLARSRFHAVRESLAGNPNIDRATKIALAYDFNSTVTSKLIRMQNLDAEITDILFSNHCLCKETIAGSLNPDDTENYEYMLRRLLECGSEGVDIIIASSHRPLPDNIRRMLLSCPSETVHIALAHNSFFRKERHQESVNVSFAALPAQKPVVRGHNPQTASYRDLRKREVPCPQYMDMFFSPKEKRELVGGEYTEACVRGMEYLSQGVKPDIHIMPQDMDGRGFGPAMMTLLNIKMMNRPDWLPVFLSPGQMNALGLKVRNIDAERTSIIGCDDNGQEVRDIVYNIADTDYPERHPEEYIALKQVLATLAQSGENSIHSGSGPLTPSRYEAACTETLERVLSGEPLAPAQKAETGMLLRHFYAVNFDACGHDVECYAITPDMMPMARRCMQDDVLSGYRFFELLSRFAQDLEDTSGICISGRGPSLDAMIREELVERMERERKRKKAKKSRKSQNQSNRKLKYDND